MPKNSQWIFVFCIVLVFTNGLRAQDSIVQKQIRFCYVFDQAYNFKDKLLTDYASRKMTFGITFSDKKQRIAISLGLGFKGFKANIFNARFTNDFLNNVVLNYTPVSEFGMDSLAGASLYNLAKGVNNNSYYLWGTYSAHASLRIVYMASRFKPMVNYYIANESFVFYSPILFYNDPMANDPKNDMTMSSLYHSVSLGFNPLPLKSLVNKPWYFSLQVGYKFVKYRPLGFDEMSMNKYLPDKMLQSYDTSKKLNLSLSFYIEIFRKGYD